MTATTARSFVTAPSPSLDISCKIRRGGSFDYSIVPRSRDEKTADRGETKTVARDRAERPGHPAGVQRDEIVFGGRIRSGACWRDARTDALSALPLRTRVARRAARGGVRAGPLAPVTGPIARGAGGR